MTDTTASHGTTVHPRAGARAPEPIRPDAQPAPGSEPTRDEAPADRRSFGVRARDATLTILHRDSTLRRSLAVADAAAFSAASVGGAMVAGAAIRPASLVFAAIGLILVAKVMGLYDRDATVLRKSTLDELPALFQLATLAALLTWFAAGTGGATVTGQIDSPHLASIWIGTFALMGFFRAAARAFSVRVSAVERCLFVGDESAAAEFRENLDTTRGVKASLVGIVGVTGRGPEPSTDAVADIVPGILREAVAHDAHRVVLAPGLASSGGLVDAIREVKNTGLKVSVLPRHARVGGSAVVIDQLNGLTLLGVRRFHITKSSRVLKRSFDLAGSLAGLALLSPLLIAIAIAIRLDTSGPALFRQQRAGRGGRSFEMLKFRSMVLGAEGRQEELSHLSVADGRFKMRDDPRVTRVGRFIRSWSLDELPQLVNVLRGEMSLVGPRPLPLEEDRLIAGPYGRRLELRPGMTGPWQVVGSQKVSLREMAHVDNQYVAEWSLWSDVRLLMLTVPHVLGRRGL